ncbi:plastocyanin/azurin family copper-binding protein [Sphingobium chlorophenolicum]|uniref:Blue (Type 1) copper domain protein n=1 Tax=Sphingobium chlorophenolicum TaxID=46429 RepID=A0A081R8J7_SPHCR|nr:plastocyanin/azurin family copper-binding protein [Sphingobium chlorophenolicum]KEQ51520.1 Blue (Type 1) copper domain protein precursor [Sphingobium chlorophenolicum]
MPHLQSLAALIALTALPLTGAGQETDAWTDARPLTLQLSSFKFEPSDILLDHGVAYDLHFVNASSGGHDFTAKAFFAEARIRPNDQAKIRDGRVEVGGGESVDVHLIASTPGSYKVRCTHFMHGALGMTGQIVVR